MSRFLSFSRVISVVAMSPPCWIALMKEGEPMEHFDTVIVGGGQAGLATSYYLTQHGREHIVLEQAAKPAHVWRDERWDSFTLVSPNWAFRIPGAEYDGPNPDAYMPRDEVVTRFAD